MVDETMVVSPMKEDNGPKTSSTTSSSPSAQALMKPPPLNQLLEVQSQPVKAINKKNIRDKKRKVGDKDVSGSETEVEASDLERYREHF